MIDLIKRLLCFCRGYHAPLECVANRGGLIIVAWCPCCCEVLVGHKWASDRGLTEGIK